MRACLIFNVVIFITISASAQDSTLVKEVLKFQETINHDFKDAEESPLTKEDLKDFKALEFFPIDSTFVVTAVFVRTPSEPPFLMETTTDRKPIYVKYGEAQFTMGNEDFILNIYQSQQLITNPEYEDYLFLPFTDNSNGEESYAGGRYLDLKIPDGKSIILNFNEAYNPYCAYSGRYSCPIPPEGNHINLSVLAGVKAYQVKRDSISESGRKHDKS